MSEGDEKKPNSAPDADRALALARKLTGGRPAVKAPQITPVPDSPRQSLSSPLSARTTAVNPDKEAMLAARRASLMGTTNQLPARKSAQPGADAKPMTVRPLLMALGAVLALALIVIGAIVGKRMLDDRTPEGRVRNELLNYEFARNNGQRDAAFAALDTQAPASTKLAIDLLADGSLAGRDDSKSERAMQALAHLYLVHYASIVRAPPPPIANEIAQKVLTGQAVPGDSWAAVRDGWRKWLADEQAKGTVPKG